MQHWLQDNHTPVQVHAQQQTPDLGHRMLSALTAAAATGTASDKCAEVAEPAMFFSCDSNGSSAASEDYGTAAAALPPLSSNVDIQQKHAALSEQQVQPQQHPQTRQDSTVAYDAVMVVGTDIPDLSAAVLDAAAAALADHDVVLGPARDGGFYLLGFKTKALLTPEVQSGQVFEAVQWSTDSVLQRTVAGVQRLGLRLAPIDTLPVLQDVDTLQDLQAWYKTATPEQQQQQQQQQHQEHQQNARLADRQGKQMQQGSQKRQQQHRQLLLQHTSALLGMQ
jgi:glycosyltransferase A (GT-A) superfamily protein (DUF2064 family)